MTLNLIGSHWTRWQQLVKFQVFLHPSSRPIGFWSVSPFTFFAVTYHNSSFYSIPSRK
ncbi:hypothetical protein BDR06DRAFT_956640 [Suillus hirtellus]|nr:hypothetical protein BDR06DRAFT_956640 [Suillus hirtellus]